MHIGERIKSRRKELGMTVDELGAVLGKDRSTIYRYEKGDIESLPLDILEPVARALRTTPAYLMGWEAETKSANNELLDTKFSEIFASMSEQTKKSFVDFMSSETNRKFFELLINANDSDLEWLEFLLKAKLEERK